MEAILGALDRHDARATFFFLGWIAERHPRWVERCLDAGHEIASHGWRHAFLQDLGPEGLEEDMAKAEGAITAAGAPKPRGFRASTFTLTRDTWWAVDVIAKRGYSYDSSVHPIQHPTYGIPGFAPGISRIDTAAGALAEFPVSTWRALGRNWPIGGGGYFRLLPGAVTRSAVRGLERRGAPACLYLHPWEFDPGQPRVKAGFSAGFRHYLNLNKTLPRLERLLDEFQFGTMEQVLRGTGLR
jgi:polysaccharide deacetylase family protein (PEP-CTERM system associated)